jgi:hypothetical protein
LSGNARSKLKIRERQGSSKTKYMRIMRNKEEDRSDLRVKGIIFEEVTTFKYLGSLITKNNEIGEEITMRFAAGNPCYYGLQHLFGSRTVSRIVKIKIYKTILKPKAAIFILTAVRTSNPTYIKANCDVWM